MNSKLKTDKDQLAEIIATLTSEINQLDENFTDHKNIKKMLSSARNNLTIARKIMNLLSFEKLSSDEFINTEK